MIKVIMIRPHFLRAWLQTICSRVPTNGHRKHRTPLRARRPWLLLEALEDRTLPTVAIELGFVYHFPEVLSAEELFRDPLSGEQPTADLSWPEAAAPQDVSQPGVSEGGATAGGSSTDDTGSPAEQTAGAANPPAQQSLLEAMAAGGGLDASVGPSSMPLSGALAAPSSASASEQNGSSGLLSSGCSSNAVLVKQVLHAAAALPFGTGTTTTSLGTSVDLSRSFVLGSHRQAADWPGNAVARFELIDEDSDPTTAEAVRVSRAGDGGNAVSGTLLADVSVVEFCSGVRVEHRTAVFGPGDSQVDLALDAIAPASQSFVLLSQSTDAAQPNQDERWAVRGELVDGGATLRLRRSETGATTTVTAQVVTLDAASGALVQTGTVTVNGSVSVNYTPQPGAGEFLFFSNSAPASADGVEGKYRVRGSLANGQATFATAASSTVWVTYYVVSVPGAVVQSGVNGFNAQLAENGVEDGVHYTEAMLAEVDRTRSFAYLTASGGTSTRNDTLGGHLIHGRADWLRNAASGTGEPHRCTVGRRRGGRVIAGVSRRSGVVCGRSSGGHELAARGPHLHLDVNGSGGAGCDKPR
jgi:hypothetical protein